ATAEQVKQKKNGNVCLLLLDPGSSASDTRKILSRDTSQPCPILNVQNKQLYAFCIRLSVKIVYKEIISKNMSKHHAKYSSACICVGEGLKQEQNLESLTISCKILTDLFLKITKQW
ncbi:hypothetical protein XENOCAPTIV_023596, partial [Xenoophorus captivus]